MKLFTIGYRAAGTSARLLAALEAHGVRRLLDARERPWGLEEFRGPALAAAAERAGVIYRHRPEFGNPYRPPRYPAEDCLELFERRARERRLGEMLALEHAGAEAAEIGPACLLCACRDQERCHRGVLARLAVEASGGEIEVEHLDPRDDGQLDLFGGEL